MATSPLHSIFPCYLSTLYVIVSFFFNDTATTEIYTLSLHDALPILAAFMAGLALGSFLLGRRAPRIRRKLDRKSTRLNSSHRCISYAVFCLKKKNTPMLVRDPSLSVDHALTSKSLGRTSSRLYND